MRHLKSKLTFSAILSITLWCTGQAQAAEITTLPFNCSYDSVSSTNKVSSNSSSSVFELAADDTLSLSANAQDNLKSYDFIVSNKRTAPSKANLTNYQGYASDESVPYNMLNLGPSNGVITPVITNAGGEFSLCSSLAPLNQLQIKLLSPATSPTLGVSQAKQHHSFLHQMFGWIIDIFSPSRPKATNLKLGVGGAVEPTPLSKYAFNISCSATGLNGKAINLAMTLDQKTGIATSSKVVDALTIPSHKVSCSVSDPAHKYADNPSPLSFSLLDQYDPKAAVHQLTQSYTPQLKALSAPRFTVKGTQSNYSYLVAKVDDTANPQLGATASATYSSIKTGTTYDVCGDSIVEESKGCDGSATTLNKPTIDIFAITQGSTISPIKGQANTYSMSGGKTMQAAIIASGNTDKVWQKDTPTVIIDLAKAKDDNAKVNAVKLTFTKHKPAMAGQNFSLSVIGSDTSTINNAPASIALTDFLSDDTTSFTGTLTIDTYPELGENANILITDAHKAPATTSLRYISTPTPIPSDSQDANITVDDSSQNIPFTLSKPEDSDIPTDYAIDKNGDRIDFKKPYYLCSGGIISQSPCAKPTPEDQVTVYALGTSNTAANAGTTSAAPTIYSATITAGGGKINLLAASSLLSSNSLQLDTSAIASTGIFPITISSQLKLASNKNPSGTLSIAFKQTIEKSNGTYTLYTNAQKLDDMITTTEITSTTTGASGVYISSKPSPAPLTPASKIAITNTKGALTNPTFKLDSSIPDHTYMITASSSGTGNGAPDYDIFTPDQLNSEGDQAEFILCKLMDTSRQELHVVQYNTTKGAGESDLCKNAPTVTQGRWMPATDGQSIMVYSIQVVKKADKDVQGDPGDQGDPTITYIIGQHPETPEEGAQPDTITIPDGNNFKDNLIKLEVQPTFAGYNADLIKNNVLAALKDDSLQLQDTTNPAIEESYQPTDGTGTTRIVASGCMINNSGNGCLEADKKQFITAIGTLNTAVLQNAPDDDDATKNLFTMHYIINNLLKQPEKPTTPSAAYLSASTPTQPTEGGSKPYIDLEQSLEKCTPSNNTCAVSITYSWPTVTLPKITSDPASITLSKGSSQVSTTISDDPKTINCTGEMTLNGNNLNPWPVNINYQADIKASQSKAIISKIGDPTFSPSSCTLSSKDDQSNCPSTITVPVTLSPSSSGEYTADTDDPCTTLTGKITLTGYTKNQPGIKLPNPLTINPKS